VHAVPEENLAVRVLCIDTEPATAQTIAAAGHEVLQGDIGFRKGSPNLPYPPHEFDLLICDLRRPACYDTTFWGPGQNDNFHCKIEKDPPDVYIGLGESARPKFEIIHSRQMPSLLPGTFGPADIFAAISKAGIPFILFLNNEWLCRVRHYPPNFSDVLWQFQRTVATKLQITPEMSRLLKTVDAVPEDIERPLAFAISKSAYRPSIESAFETKPLVLNAVSQIFSEVVLLERGAIWALPQFLDNASFCLALIKKFDAFLALQASLLGRTDTKAQKLSATAADAMTMRDVFISHASEDKVEVARPLADALVQRGLSIWFDEYELTLGDHLRRKIEEGLRVSRYGVTVLSENFFKKKWPQAELDALFALEKTETKKILPVWHKLSEDDIKRYAPLLADRLAVSTDAGIGAVADKIVHAVQRQSRSN
jgi:hypothetical protein